MEQLEMDVQILREKREEQMEKMELLSKEVSNKNSLYDLNFSLNKH